MPTIAVVREAEPWNLPNIIGGLLLLVVVGAFILWLVRRYLSS